jgi:hypothetical protein
MALVGGAVSLHAPTKWRWKIGYAAVFAVLGGFSVVYVIKQSNEGVVANRHLDVALAKLRESTTKIADRTALNSQLQDKLLKQSDTITDLARENIAAVTGGNSHCYIIASPVGGEFMLNITTRGSLHEAFVEMVDVDILRTLSTKHFLSFQDIQSFTTSFTTSYPAIPFLASSSGRTLNRIPVGGSDKRNLHFNFFSMNGVWGEDLNLRFVKGHGNRRCG